MESKKQIIKAVAAISAVAMTATILLPGCNLVGKTPDNINDPNALVADANSICCPQCNSSDVAGPDADGFYTCNSCGSRWDLNQSNNTVEVVDDNGNVVATVPNTTSADGSSYFGGGSSYGGSSSYSGGSSSSDSGSSYSGGSNNNGGSTNGGGTTVSTTKAGANSSFWTKIKNGISDPETFKKIASDFSAIANSVTWYMDSEGNLTALSPKGENVDSGFFGFKYNTKDDVFITAEDAWQRNFGYTETYDKASGVGAISYDTIRVFYTYDNKDWMVQFWKGQYGFVMIGAEIGVYNRPVGTTGNTYYNCANDEDKLTMSMEVYRGTSSQNSSDFTKLFTRSKYKTWWLTGFTPGTLNAGSYVVNAEKNRYLRQDAIFYFETPEEAQAFIGGLKNVSKVEHNAPTTTYREISFKEFSSLEKYNSTFVDGKFYLEGDGKTLHVSFR